MSGNYIVVFKDNVSADEVQKYADDVNANGGSVTTRFTSLMKGFSASIPDSYLQQLKSFEGSTIDYIEPDSAVTIQ